MEESPFASLKAALRGTLITREDEDAFTAARSRGWNRDLNLRANPLAFAVVSGVRDIVTTVNYCRSNKIPIAVRGKGAHSPYGMANNAVVIDLMKMTAVSVDPEKKLAYIQAGADGGDVDHETALHNLICITGSVSHTGFAGVALGGGLGHLSRWLGPVVDSIVSYEMVTAAGEVIRVDEASDPELFWGMRGNGASFGIVTEFVVRLRDMPNGGIIRSAPILWAADKAKEVMTSWMGRIGRGDRKETETLQFVFMHSPDGLPVCGVVPLIVGETEAAAKATCDELASFGGGAQVRHDTQLPYTALQAALDTLVPFNTNYWDKGVFINWDPRDTSAVNSIVDVAVKHWSEKPEFASKLSTFILFMEVDAAVGRADPASTSFAGRKGRLWCSCITSWPDDDASQRAASKRWCGELVAKLSRFHVTSYLNNAMPESEAEMLEVFPQDTMKRLRALKEKVDPNNVFKTGAWQYEANK
ncbi:FAD-binding oxidoreductase [Caenimonas soli]|uniref:FAD-binding oxidoreductase n=1 Tax=Caenimonas soli TaxID=2735555 RepID=UPI0015579DA0|nr:FAD-binding oxidoreductase [Caenimonas soli]NPC55818.1 FAD-binding oxidoreductase [Caenimonas soli]